VEIHLRRQKQDGLEMSSVATIGSANVEVKKCPKPPLLEPSIGVRVHCPLHHLPRSCRLPPLSCHTSSRSPAKVQCSDQLRHRIAAVDEASLFGLKACRALLHGHLRSPLDLTPLLPLDLHPFCLRILLQLHTTSCASSVTGAGL
jgi:hypothetical protein